MQDNDLVVNSHSMYLGTVRHARVQYFFDEADNVDHFHYFKNKKTNDAILRGLTALEDEQVAGFIIFIQPSAIQPLRTLIEGGQLDPDIITGKRPIVILLPGIMGSNIGSDNYLLWINYLRFLTGHLLDLKDLNDFKPLSIVKTSYKKLKDFLSDTYDVATFPFDWRLPLNEVADTLKNFLK